MPLNDTPCEKCGNRAHLMAGVNVLPKFKDRMFLVCWRCKKISRAAKDRRWVSFAEAGIVRRRRS